MRFIDLFAGLGGFHVALKRLDHECVYASEIDAELQTVYFENFGLMPYGDIRLAQNLEAVPSHDILCAGFPCQPFSKAGEQQGLDHPEAGDLFDHVLRILAKHRPPFFLLENVPNLARHNRQKTWSYMADELRKLGYAIDHRPLSPHEFGIPQVRQRLFIVGALGERPLAGFTWPAAEPDTAPPDLRTVLDSHPPDARPLTRQARSCLEVWQEFFDRFPADQELPSFPIWSMEFGATYPFQGTTPWATGAPALRAYQGAHGMPLTDVPSGAELASLPSYAQTKDAKFPTWKATFIRQNRELYERNRAWLDDWMPKVLEFPPSLRKLEWNCKGEARQIWDYVIQFRASGVRVKRPTTAPSLVAMTTTQVPVIAWENRYMTVRECARLQGLGDLRHWPRSATAAFGALGNAVNVDLVEWIAASLVSGDQMVSGGTVDRHLTMLSA